MDDRLLRVGSSNLNNRSLGFDSECDLAVEVSDSDDRSDDHRAAIRQVRDRLLGEHLDVGTEAFRKALDQHSSLVAAIDALRGDGKTLVEFDRDIVDGEENPLAENELMDPEQAPSSVLERTYRSITRRRLARRQLTRN
jgi:phosphatidylserine/phosphatidylglycerophosphate/cardiolipin synthase-like enzyme